MPTTSLKLEGQFKFDIYDSNHKLLRSSDFQDNFITNSGVVYPYYFAFADCFRYLSLGTGTGLNSTGVGVYPATIGLDYPISEFSYIGTGNLVTGGYLGGGCGNLGFNNSISLIRQWVLPDITGGVFQAAYPFSEMMVSPGRPPNAQGLCVDTQGSEFTTPGPESSPIAKYYESLYLLDEQAIEQGGNGIARRTRPSMCSASGAFARILSNMEVVSGETLTIIYKLNLTFDTGISRPNQFRNEDRVGNFSKIGLIGNLTNPGIKLINDGSVPEGEYIRSYADDGWRRQHGDYTSANQGYDPYYFNQNYGESFIPTLGIPLEPSIIYGDKGNIKVYISDDNIEFFVSSSGGAWDESKVPNPPQNSGLLPFENSVNSTKFYASNSVDAADYYSRTPCNIRLTDSSSFSNRPYPETGNVIEEIGANSHYYYSSFSTPRFSYNGRSGILQNTYEFVGYPHNGDVDILYMKSFVAAYVDALIFDDFEETSFMSIRNSKKDGLTKAPFYDCLFSGISGASIFLPTFVGSAITNAGSTEYNSLTKETTSTYPVITTRLMWTAACPGGVRGC